MFYKLVNEVAFYVDSISVAFEVVLLSVLFYLS